MINLNAKRKPGQRICELGGGDNPVVHPKCLGGQDLNVDVRIVTNRQGQQSVDFAADFNEVLPIQSEEWDAVVSIFCLEHVSWRKTEQFVKEMFRIIKPGGWILIVVPNTEAQMKYILSKPEFDGDEGSMIFGSLDYEENSHRAAFSPKSITKLFSSIGFENIVITPYGEPLKTDMMLEAVKPSPVSSFMNIIQSKEQQPEVVKTPPVIKEATSLSKPAGEIYDRDYFENYQSRGVYWNYPENYVIAQKILERRPFSVLELGCGKGFVLKMVEDAGIPSRGIDVSRHAFFTGVSDNISTRDVILNKNWTEEFLGVDLCYSLSFLEHIPEQYLPTLMEDLKKVSVRGLHGVTLEGKAQSHDPTRCTLKSLDFWKKILPENHEVVDINELGRGVMPEEILKSGGRIRLNIGSGFNMHYGWMNIDTIDGETFARAFHFDFMKHDVRQGLPYATSVASCLFLHHFLEYLTYEEGIRFLRECRRVIRPDGCMRIVTPAFDEIQVNYYDHDAAYYDDIDKRCVDHPTSAGKVWSFLLEGRKSIFDGETLKWMLEESGWDYNDSDFRETKNTAIEEILKTTNESWYGGNNLYCDALPKLG